MNDLFLTYCGDDLTGSTDSLEATAPLAIADAVWDETITGHVGASSSGLYVTSLYQGLVPRTAQCGDAGSSTTIDLDGAASAVTDFFKGQLIAIVAGTGIGQARTCTAYNGTTKVATVSPAWATTPDGDSYFMILNTGSTVPVTQALTVAEIADGIWDEAVADHLTAGTFGFYLSVIMLLR